MKSACLRPLFICLCLILTSVSTQTTAQQLGVAGSPVASIQGKGFQQLFETLRGNGINSYFPTFQYQEVPAPKSLGFETDFVAPCSADDPAFQALRNTGMKLIIPGEYVYPKPGRIGRTTSANDPLNRIIACAGRNQIAAITNYDEAAFQGRSINDVAKFYAQVKKIDPTLPVLMVHGPIITDKRAFSSQSKIARYLEEVIAYSAHADVVGFDVYPVPAFLAKVATPFSGGVDVAVDRAVGDYMAWLNQAVPNKRKLMVLQGFAYSDLYEKSYREANFPAELLATIKAPDKKEMALMLRQARDAGVEFVIWWGPSALPSNDAAPWQTILDLGRKYGR
ncbi:MAG: hypothetical protein WBC93_02805 [Sulfitobacter sp.]